MVKIENLCFAYHDKSLLKEINIQFEKGKISVILGRNGAGKSTLVNCLCGISKPNQGEIFISGVKIQKLSSRQIAQNLAVVRQDTHYVFPYQVIEIVLMGRTPHLSFLNAPAAEDIEIAYEALNMVGMKSFAKRKINELSSGERQMVLLARAICQQTPIFILDEPNAHLDIHNQWRLLQLVEKLCREKKRTIIAVIHLPEIAYWLADKVFMLKDGQIKFQGTPQQVMTPQNLSEIYDMPMHSIHVGKNFNAIIPSFVTQK